MCWLRHVATRTSEAHGVEVHRLSGQPLPLARRLQRHLQAGMRQKTWAAERFSWGISRFPDSAGQGSLRPKMMAVHGSVYPSQLCPRQGHGTSFWSSRSSISFCQGLWTFHGRVPLLCWTDLLTTPVSPARAGPSTCEDCFRCPRPKKNESALREICEELADRPGSRNCFSASEAG